MPPKQPTLEYNFASHHPHLLDEWDYEKNSKQPNQYTPSSGQRVWWICRVCKHNWECNIDNRIKPRGCPCCAGKKPHSDGHNSLAALRPKIVLDWNDKRSPEELRIGSHYRAKWKCHKCEHEWRTPIYKRAEMGRRCLSCTGQQAHSSGRDSVKIRYPELMDEWNDDRDPEKFLPGSSVMIQWKCRDCSHEWPMPVKIRTPASQPGSQGGSGCTFCNGPGGNKSRAIHTDGRNSMRVLFPKLSMEFHPTMNNDRTPENTIAGINKHIWWICNTISKEPCGYIWPATGAHRSLLIEPRGCPACAETGYNPSIIGYVYVHYYQDEINNWLKCGITNHPSNRFISLKRSAENSGIEITQLEIYKFDDGYNAQQCERELLTMKSLRFDSGYDVDGKAEFFKYEALDEIKKLILDWL